MNMETLFLTAYGAYMMGYNLERLEWVISATNDAAQIAPHIGVLRKYEQIHPFEVIGQEAKYYHDIFSGYIGQPLPNNAMVNLRDVRVRWEAIVAERLQDLFLVTPRTRIEPKTLTQGIIAFLNPQHHALLEGTEVKDLNEACGCLLIGSATAAEFIALRSAESLLRRWYEYKTGKELTQRGWGKVLNKLADEYPEEKRPKEITHLGYLKMRRDEVAHPDRISTLTDAEATLMSICSLIESIAPVLTELALSREPEIQPQMPIPELPSAETN